MKTGRQSVIWLEDENFEEAKEISDQYSDEEQQWQAYKIVLALGAMETWFSTRTTKNNVNREPTPPNLFNAVCNLRVGDFRICLIVIDSFLDVVSIPKQAIELPTLAAHFYVAIEVLEDEEQALLRGVIRYDQLMKLREQGNLKLQGDFYRLALACFDSQVDHLLVYLNHLNVSAIPLPSYIWEDWSQIKATYNRDHVSSHLGQSQDTGKNIDKGRLIDLGVKLGNKHVVLRVIIGTEEETKRKINVELHPYGKGENYLPSHLKLSLIIGGKARQDVESTLMDNYIRLQTFRIKSDGRFVIQLILQDFKFEQEIKISDFLNLGDKNG